MVNSPDVSFIIVAWNGCELTLECLCSIFDPALGGVRGLTFEVLLVDNASSDGTAEAVGKEFPKVKVIVNREHMGFGAANNLAIRRARGRFLALLNNDTKLTPNAMEEIVKTMDLQPDIGAAGPQLLNEDGSKQNSMASFPSVATELFNKAALCLLFPGRHPSKYFEHDSQIEVDSLIGACMVLRAEAMEDVGLFDEDYYFFLEETDLCFRLKERGWRICHVPRAQVYHRQGASTKRRPGSEARIEYCKSLYKFFEKNRSRSEFRILRGLYILKLVGEFLLRGYACVGTLFCHAESRMRLGRYWDLISWHWRLCPDSQGFGGKMSRRRCGRMEGEA